MKIITLCICILAMFTAEAQVGKGMMKATVTDISTGEPLPFVNVALRSGDAVVTGGQTDENGFVRIASIDPGIYEVTLSFIGYEPVTIPGVSIKAGQDTRLRSGQTQMSVSALMLREVEIVEQLTALADAEVTSCYTRWMCGFESYAILTYRDVDSNTTSTAPVDEPSWSIYPNPTKSFVYLEHSHPLDELTVLDMNGNVVRTLNSIQSRQTIDMQHLAAGAYFIRFRQGNEWVNAKVLRID